MIFSVCAIAVFNFGNEKGSCKNTVFFSAEAEGEPKNIYYTSVTEGG